MFELALSNDRAFLAMCYADFVHEGHEHTIIARSSEEIEQRSFIFTFPCKTLNAANIVMIGASLSSYFVEICNFF